jgi:hypothetical protein
VAAAEALIPHAAKIDLEAGPPSAMVAEPDFSVEGTVAFGRVELGEGVKVPRSCNSS